LIINIEKLGMVKNKIGGNKSKNIGSKFTKKKIVVEEPDFENSFFGIISTKPNGMMCQVKLCKNDKVEMMMKEYDIPEIVQANIGKLKNDKRNNMLNSGDYVQVEFNFDMKRQNGNVYAYILCKYDNDEIKYFRKSKMLPKDDSDEETNLPPSESDDEEIDLDKL
jgi:hypothetical protein